MKTAVQFSVLLVEIGNNFAVLKEEIGCEVRRQSTKLSKRDLHQWRI